MERVRAEPRDDRARPGPRGHARPSRSSSTRTRRGRCVVGIDTGIKDSIVRNLRERGVRLELHPCSTSAEELLARDPDAVFLANGPGDPAALDYVVDTVRDLVGKVPVWGICLGHQLLCRAVGLETFKLPFGHRGANHPVKDLETGRIEITSQNHGFAVLGPDGEQRIETDEPVRWDTDFGVAELQQVNLYDRTVEGLVLRDVPGLDGPVPPRGGPRPARRAAPLRPLPGAAGRRLMPRRDDIQKILVIGSGPIVIGQAAEFDYSGAQACKVLLEEGYEVVLVNSNPATIMTDPEFATATYIEPLLPDSVAKVIERERPDALLPTLGGGTALNLARQLTDDGTLGRYRVELIGANYDVIRRAEDRDLFRATMERAGLRVPSAAPPSSRCARPSARSPNVGLPGDRAPGLHDGRRRAAASRAPTTEYRQVVAEGLAASPIGQVLVEESVIGWGEFELEVMRDHADNVVIVCSIENVDPMGVHTGDSVTVAPQQTLSDAPVPAAARPGDHGDPRRGRGDGRLEHPVRGQPGDRRDRGDRDEPARLAQLRARLEGHRLPDREDRRAPGGGLRARGDRQRHHQAHARELRAHARLRGREVAALRLREVPGRRRRAPHLDAVGRRGDGDRPHLQAGVREGDALARARRGRRPLGRPARPGSRPRRTTATSCSSRRSAAGRTRRRSAAARASTPGSWPRSPSWRAGTIPRPGSSGPSRRWTPAPPSSRPRRPTTTPAGSARAVHEVRRGDRPAVAILGSGPNRIGQGIEFDYCCVHAAMTVRESGRDAVMINCNPETVSTDYDTSDRLYFEPLTLEDVLGVLELEQPGGRDRPVRRPDAAQARARPGRRGRPAAGHPGRLDPPRGGPAQLRRAARGARAAQPAVRHGGRARRGARRRRQEWATRCWCGPPTCSAAGPWRSATRPTACATTSSGSAPTCPAARSSSTASSRTPSRSTWTRSATARTCGSGRSCSTSRRPASTPGTRPA